MPILIIFIIIISSYLGICLGSIMLAESYGKHVPPYIAWRMPYLILRKFYRKFKYSPKAAFQYLFSGYTVMIILFENNVVVFTEDDV